MRVFAAGLFAETNTFSALPTSLEDFQIRRCSDAAADGPAAGSFDLAQVWGRKAQARGDEFVLGLMAWAQSGGLVSCSAYETLRDEILRDLEAALPVDVVLLMLHGAMIAQGYEDCEEDILRRVRALVGVKSIVGVEFDLHCHLSESKIAPADLIISYKEYPHTDIHQRAEELFELGILAASGAVRPTMALFDCRMVGIYPTTREPLQRFVRSLYEAERSPGVLSVSFGHGFQFADVPNMGAKILAVTDNDLWLAQKVAKELGGRVHTLRRQIGFESTSLSLEEGLSEALQNKQYPVVVADQSDNIGGGAPGDATFALHWLLDHGGTDVGIAILYDPQVVAIAKKAGEGAVLPMRVGGKLGPTSGTPVDIEATVLAIRHDYVHGLPQEGGSALAFPAGDVVLLRAPGRIDIVVSSLRCQCFTPAIFEDLGLDPREKRVLIPKSAQHFYTGFAPIAAKVLHVASSGAVAPDPRLLPYRRVDTRRLYPWVDEPFAVAPR